MEQQGVRDVSAFALPGKIIYILSVDDVQLHLATLKTREKIIGSFVMRKMMCKQGR
jgi:hypothetical protein